MNHLNEDQLSALADGMLEGAARAAAERHLASCAPCRESLAGLLALDRDLRGALEHDPGEAYFETFAARVGGRIRAAGLRGAQARVPEGRGLADWFRSPRKLAALGAVATVVVVAGVVMFSSREVGMPVVREGAVRRAVEQATPPAGTPAPTAEPVPAAVPEAGPATGADAARAADAVTVTPPAAERAVPAPAATGAREPAVARDEAPRAAKHGEQLAATAPVTPAEAPPAAARREGGMRVAGDGTAAAPRQVVPSADGATATTTSEAGAAKGAAADRATATTTSEADAAKGAAGVLPEGKSSLLQRTRQSLSATKAETAGDGAFAAQPTFTSLHGRNALRLTRLAETMRVAPAWDSAAEEWATVLLGTVNTALEPETRWQLARARWRAWQAGASEKRAARAGEAFADFLASAPAGARRDSVEAWRAAVVGTPAR